MTTYELGSVDTKFKEKLEGFKLTFNSIDWDQLISFNYDELKIVEYLIRQTFELADKDTVVVNKTDKSGVYNICINGMVYEIEIKLGPTED